MADRPILFSGPMVRALLEGRKTQTRRVLKPQPTETAGLMANLVHVEGEPVPRLAFGRVLTTQRMPVAVGDHLWVKETHAVVGTVDPGWVLYRASGYEAECARHGFDNYPSEDRVTWRPSIFMPRRLSRLTLEVTTVRVQRVREITAEDAVAEGIDAVPEAFHDDGPCPVSDPDCLGGEGECHDACRPVDVRTAFSRLWDGLNAKRGFSWAVNPWVVAVGFTVAGGNIDQLQ